MSDLENEKSSSGRPTIYNEEIIKEICNAISSSSKGLMRLCKENPGWPAYPTLKRWLRENAIFKSQYDQAKRDQADFMIEECLEISDNSTNDTLTKQDKSGDTYEAPNTEWVMRSKLKVDTRKWIAAKLYPKYYGERQNHDEDSAKKIDVSKLSVEEAKELMNKLFDKFGNK